MTLTQIQELVDQLPPYLRGLRMKIMLRAFSQHAIPEVECPACHGSGQLGAPGPLGPAPWDRCPLCCRQGVVPLGVATWWAEQMSVAPGMRSPLAQPAGVAGRPVRISERDIAGQLAG